MQIFRRYDISVCFRRTGYMSYLNASSCRSFSHPEVRMWLHSAPRKQPLRYIMASLACWQPLHLNGQLVASPCGSPDEARLQYSHTFRQSRQVALLKKRLTDVISD